MNMLVDAVLVIIFLYFTFKFYKIGILGAFFGTMRMCISLAASYLLGGSVSRLILTGITKSREYSKAELVLSLITAYILVFAIVFLLMTVVISSTRRAEPRFIYKIDRFLGALLGIMLGLCATSVISSLLYSGIEVAYTILLIDPIKSIYNDSVVFKTVFELSIFDYVRNLIY